MRVSIACVRGRSLSPSQPQLPPCRIDRIIRHTVAAGVDRQGHVVAARRGEGDAADGGVGVLGAVDLHAADKKKDKPTTNKQRQKKKKNNTLPTTKPKQTQNKKPKNNKKTTEATQKTSKKKQKEQNPKNSSLDRLGRYVFASFASELVLLVTDKSSLSNHV